LPFSIIAESLSIGHSPTVDAINDADFVSRFVRDRLIAKSSAFGKTLLLTQFSQGADDPDSKLVFLSQGKPALVIIISPALFPNVVAEECRKAAEMRALLGDLGAPILEPLDAGRILASTYAVLPYRKPLSQRRILSRLDELRVNRHLFDWLLQIARKHSVSGEVSGYERAFRALDLAVSPDSAAAALLRKAERHLRSGRFVARSVPMHGDLWKGNVLRGAGSAPFTLVDWRGSSVDGFPIFDLIRAASSFHLSPTALCRQLQLHRAALGCQMEDLPLYLLAALGHFAERRGEMPLTTLHAMIEISVMRLSGALATLSAH